MKKVIIAGLLLWSGLLAEEKNSKFIIHDLMVLEMPGKIVKSGALDMNSDQMVRLSQEVQPLMHEKYQIKINEVFGLEKRAQKLLKEGKSKEELKGILDQISKLKREAMDIKIDAYNAFKAILTKEQWQKYLELSAKK